MYKNVQMAEREAGKKNMKRLSEQSLDLARVFSLKQAKSLYYFSLRPGSQKLKKKRRAFT
jgi:hypothetical protein